MKENQPVVSKGNIEIFKKIWEPRIHYQNHFFNFFSTLPGKWVYTQVDNRKISVADSNN
jgi:hypothetical protein